MKVKKQFLSLIELMLVMGIIGLVAGILTFNIRKTIVEQRFRSEVDMVVDKLRLAQNFMLILDTDVHFKLIQTDNGIKYWLEFSCPLSKGWSQELSKPSFLRTIHVVNFKDQLPMTEKSGEIDIRFLSGGMVMSRGVLRLSTSELAGDEKGLEKFVCLRGYPYPIFSVPDSQGTPTCISPNDTLIDDQLTNSMIQEIASKKTLEEKQTDTQDTGKERKIDANIPQAP